MCRMLMESEHAQEIFVFVDHCESLFCFCIRFV